MNDKIRLLDHVGETPFVRLRFQDARDNAQIWGKLEFMNPSGSIKDRMCKAIVGSMESQGVLKSGDSIVEASAGNTAISLAMVCSSRGYKLTLVMPESVPAGRRNLLAAYGAEIILTPASNGMKGSVTRAMEILDSRKRMHMLNQFENPANPEAHRRYTAAEIIRGLGRVPDVFVAGVGTGGTITGVGEAFKEQNPSTKIVAVEPADSAVLSGGDPGPHRIYGIGAGFVPRILNTDIIDDVTVVEYEDALKMVNMLAEKDGIYAGISSGATIYAAMKHANGLGEGKVVATVLCDSGERYLY
jgi:cysteine synthase